MKNLHVLLLALLVGSVFSQTASNTCIFFNVYSAALDPTYGPSTGGNAITFDDPNIPGGSATYNFVYGFQAATIAGGTIVISGTLVPTNGNANTLDVRMTFRATTGTPKRELQDAAYVPTGTIDPSTWTYYAIDPANSYMIGHGDLEGYTVDLTAFDGMPLQVGTGANGKNLNFGASGWFSFAFRQGNVVVYTSDKVVDINVDIACNDCDSHQYRATDANADTSIGGVKGGQALFITSNDLTPFGGFDRWSFVDNSGLVTIEANNNLVLQGNFAPTGGDQSVRMSCYINFYWIASSELKKELPADAYLPNGKIDPNLWKLYRVNTGSYCTYNGNQINITGNAMDMPLQLGNGGNGKNANFGMGVWMTYANGGDSVIDINVDLTCIIPDTPTPTPTESCTWTCVPNAPTATPTVTPTATPTATPVAGNSAGSIEISKILVAGLSLLALVFVR
ncbi:hypothetical protein CYY_001612 [Polysphondylium violaceum]|uniref:Uncharacterized protein n=1 Tax=Polysphondylium violaceum TaxID=133409 RepID=A0A8J4PY11_9MYCE|nr:hypothetical protein CYY_001612 [Polysphondylium violaceum]